MKIPRFSVVLWIAAILIALFLVGGPLAQNEWARWKWHEVPCYRTDLNYEFMFGDTKITATRLNFWGRRIWSHTGAVVPMQEANDKCWVNPSDPEDTVLRLDTATNWSAAGGHVCSAILVLVGAAVIVFVERRKKMRRTAGKLVV